MGLNRFRIVKVVAVGMAVSALVIATWVTNAVAKSNPSALGREVQLEQVVNGAIAAGVPGAKESSHKAPTSIQCLPDARGGSTGPRHYLVTEHFRLPDHDSGPSAIRSIERRLRSHFTVKLFATKTSAVVQAPSNGTMQGMGVFVWVLWSKQRGTNQIEAEIKSACDLPG
jgi:hypothetical protein